MSKKATFSLETVPYFNNNADILIYLKDTAGNRLGIWYSRIIGFYGENGNSTVIKYRVNDTKEDNYHIAIAFHTMRKLMEEANVACYEAQQAEWYKRIYKSAHVQQENFKPCPDIDKKTYIT